MRANFFVEHLKVQEKNIDPFNIALIVFGYLLFGNKIILLVPVILISATSWVSVVYAIIASLSLLCYKALLFYNPLTLQFDLNSFIGSSQLLSSLSFIFILFVLAFHDLKKKATVEFYLSYLAMLVPFVVYLLSNSQPPLWDQSRHYFNVLLLKQSILENGLLFSFLEYHFYTNLQYILSAGLTVFSGSTYTGITISYAIVWLFILLYFANRLFHEVFKLNKRDSIVAAFIFASAPSLLSNIKEFMLDYQLVALCCGCFLYSLKYSEKKNIKYTLKISGLCVAGFMIKQSYLVFGAAIFISSFVYCIAKDKKISLITLKHYALSCVLFLLPVVFWFGLNGSLFFWDSKSSDLNAASEGDPLVYTISSAVWYAKDTFYSYIGWMTSIVLLVCAVINYKKINVSIWVFSLFYLIVYTAFTLKYNKDMRYAIPLAVIAIPFIASVFNGKITGKIAILVLLLISANNFLYFQHKDFLKHSKIIQARDNGSHDVINKMEVISYLNRYIIANGNDLCFNFGINPKPFHQWGVTAYRKYFDIDAPMKIDGDNCKHNEAVVYKDKSVYVSYEDIEHSDIALRLDPATGYIYIFKILKSGNEEYVYLDDFHGQNTGDYQLFISGQKAEYNYREDIKRKAFLIPSGATLSMKVVHASPSLTFSTYVLLDKPVEWINDLVIPDGFKTR